MLLGERLKKRRKEKKMSADFLAKELGISVSTIYRYEDSSIEKIPVSTFGRLCELLDTTPAEMMGNSSVDAPPKLPEAFDNAQDAMEFILKMPTIAEYGGYSPEKMDEETIMQFANEILQQLKLVSYKYK